MIFLVATAGNSGLGKRSFPGPAIYDVSDEEDVQEWSHRSGSKQLFLIQSDEPPVITTQPAGPLRSLRGWQPSVLVPQGGRVLVSFADDRIILPPQAPSEPGEPGEPTYAYVCKGCDRNLPSEAILARHREVEHP